MSKNFKFKECSIVDQFGMNLRDNYTYIWIDTRTPSLYRTLFAAIADTLKYRQSKDKNRIGFKMLDDKGNFLLGAVLNYRKPDADEDEDTGNWYLEFTFYEEDMTNLDDLVDNHSKEFCMCAGKDAHDIMSGRFNNIQFMNILFVSCVNTLKDWLDANATEEEEVELTLDGVFTASVVVENGVKIMSIVPGEVTKQLIKGDSIL